MKKMDYRVVAALAMALSAGGMLCGCKGMDWRGLGVGLGATAVELGTPVAMDMYKASQQEKFDAAAPEMLAALESADAEGRAALRAEYEKEWGKRAQAVTGQFPEECGGAGGHVLYKEARSGWHEDLWRRQYGETGAKAEFKQGCLVGVEVKIQAEELTLKEAKQMAEERYGVRFSKEGAKTEKQEERVQCFRVTWSKITMTAKNGAGIQVTVGGATAKKVEKLPWEEAEGLLDEFHGSALVSIANRVAGGMPGAVSFLWNISGQGKVPHTFSEWKAWAEKVDVDRLRMDSERVPDGMRWVPREMFRALQVSVGKWEREQMGGGLRQAYDAASAENLAVEDDPVTLTVADEALRMHLAAQEKARQEERKAAEAAATKERGKARF